MATTPARRVPARGAPAQASSGYRGAEGRRKMLEEEERAAARKEATAAMSGMPFRFYCPVGEEREYIIIDDKPDFFRFEHNLKDSRTNKWTVFCSCINENANCPVCKIAERPSYFAMYLTIIDLTPYESNSGETVDWSKKLLVVKPAQQKKFTRLLERHGTLRGMLMKATRDGEKDAAIGNDQEFLEFIEEEDLLTYESEYTDKKDKVHEVIGHEVFDYDDLFPFQTEQQLRALVGGVAEPGSRDEDNRATGRRSTPARRGGDDWDKNDERPTRAAAVSRRTSRPAAEEEEPEAPARRTAPIRRGAADRISEEDNPETGAEPEAPVRGRTAPTRPTPTRAATSVRRPVREEEEVDEVEEEDPPQRGRAAPATRAAPTSLADKRRALRR